MILRNYQKECIQALKDNFKGNNKGIISIPTGGGKTVIFNSFAYTTNLKTLVISHTEELVNQAIDKAHMLYNIFETGIIQQSRWEVDKKYISASIQTLYCNIGNKIFHELKNVGLVIIDESHHFPAQTYQDVYNQLKRLNQDIKLLGVTATPFRTDEQNLKDHFDNLVYSIDIDELMHQEYLVRAKGKRIPLLNSYKNPDGDSDNGLIVAETKNEKEVDSITQIIELNDKFFDEVINNWIKYGENRKTIFFCHRVIVSGIFAERLKAKGIQACHIDGATKNREQIINDFRNNKIKIICNVDVLTEGFDDPSVECIVLLRNTESLVLYTQMIGRGLRLSYDTFKKDCLILDFTGKSYLYDVLKLSNFYGIQEQDDDVRTQEEKDEDDEDDKKKKKKKKTDILTLKVLNDDEISDFDLVGTHLFKYITDVNGYKVLGCGFSGKYIICTQDSEFEHLYNIYVIEQHGNDKYEVIEQSLHMTKDYCNSSIVELWKTYRDIKFTEYYLKKMFSEPSTLKQKAFLSKHKSKIKQMNDIEKTSKLEASNIMTFLFFKWFVEPDMMFRSIQKKNKK